MNASFLAQQTQRTLISVPFLYYMFVSFPSLSVWVAFFIFTSSSVCLFSFYFVCLVCRVDLTLLVNSSSLLAVPYCFSFHFIPNSDLIRFSSPSSQNGKLLGKNSFFLTIVLRQTSDIQSKCMHVIGICSSGI